MIDKQREKYIDKILQYMFEYGYARETFSLDGKSSNEYCVYLKIEPDIEYLAENSTLMYHGVLAARYDNKVQYTITTKHFLWYVNGLSSVNLSDTRNASDEFIDTIMTALKNKYGIYEF